MKIHSIRKLALALFLAVGMTTARAWADEVTYLNSNSGSNRLSLEAGLAIPTQANDFSTSEKIGPVVGLQYLWGLSPHWRLGLQADYFHFSPQDRVMTSNFGGQVNARSTDDAGTAEVVAHYILLPDARVVPYVLGSLGAIYYRQKTEGEPVNGSAWVDTPTTETRSLQDDHSVNVSYSGGLGVETGLGNHLLLALEAVWHTFSVNKDIFGTTFINFPTITLRLGWRFGESAEHEFETSPPPTVPGT